MDKTQNTFPQSLPHLHRITPRIFSPKSCAPLSQNQGASLPGPTGAPKACLIIPLDAIKSSRTWPTGSSCLPGRSGGGLYAEDLGSYRDGRYSLYLYSSLCISGLMTLKMPRKCGKVRHCVAHLSHIVNARLDLVIIFAVDTDQV